LDLVEIKGFDYVRAGARLLGRDIASIGEPETIGRIREILAKETADQGRVRLVQAMMAGQDVSDEERKNRFGELRGQLRQLLMGIEHRATAQNRSR
jgi:predicted nucleotidyltransferase